MKYRFLIALLYLLSSTPALAAGELSAAIISSIQQQYQGRVIGVRLMSSAEPPCREFQQDIVIGGSTEKSYGITCPDGAGGWQRVAPYEVQVLTQTGRVIFVIVNGTNGQIMSVKQ